ncbi:MAG: DUF4345 domain-containing protein [Pseudomonadota bacterium]
MKRAFQIVLVVSNLVPLLLGIAVAINGAAFFVPINVIDASFEAQIRVYAIWFTGIFFLSVWMAFNIETCGPILRIVFSLVALAGASRVYSMVSMGSYPTSTAIAAVVEMATIVFIPWHGYLIKKATDPS